VTGCLTSCARRTQTLQDEGIAGDLRIFRNNTDFSGNSYGSHENYLVERSGELQPLVDALLPFLVTRQIFAGAGKVLLTARGRGVRPLPAGRAHLGRRLVRDDPLASRHQQP
jgi:hypothetical protein